MKKRWLTIGAAMLLAGVGNAYGWSLKEAAAPYKGETITVVGLERPSYVAAQKLTPEFEKETGIHVKWDIYPYESTLKAEMLNFVSNSQEYDVVLTDVVWPVTFVDGGWVLPVKHFLDDSKLRDPDIDIKDFFPIWLASFTVNGKLYGLPFDSYSGLLYYNKSMFKAAGIDNPPKTWNELKSDAEKLTDKSKNIYGYALQSALGETQTCDSFARFLWPWGGRFINTSTHKVLVNDQKSINGIEFRQNLMKYMPPGIVSDDHAQVVQLLTQKRVAMITEWSAFYTTLKHSAIGNELGIAPEPKGPYGAYAAFGGFAYMVSAQVPVKRQNAAWLFVQWLTSKKMAMPLIEDGAVVARKKADTSPEVQEKAPYLKTMTYTWEHATVPNFRPQLSCYPRFSTIVSDWGTKIMLSGNVKSGLNGMQKTLTDYMKASHCWEHTNAPQKYISRYEK